MSFMAEVSIKPMRWHLRDIHDRPSKDTGDVTLFTNPAASICGIFLMHFVKSIFISAHFHPQVIATV